MVTVGFELMLRNRKNPKDLYLNLVDHEDYEMRCEDSVIKILISIIVQPKVTVHR
jgi:hypothetical protein